MMERWLEQAGKTRKLSTDILHEIIVTCRGLVGLSKYLLEHHVLKYVLLGKVQSDKIEGHFGHLRKLAGGTTGPLPASLWRERP